MRYTAKKNIYKMRVRTNVHCTLGKQSISFMAKDLPTHLKKLKSVCISKEIYMLSTIRTTNEINFHLTDEATYGVHCTM